MTGPIDHAMVAMITRDIQAALSEISENVKGAVQVGAEVSAGQIETFSYDELITDAVASVFDSYEADFAPVAADVEGLHLDAD